jgi:hypothetical protein
MKYAITLVAVTLAVGPTQVQAVDDYDLVIYGGTSAAVTAAVQARKMGKTAVIIEPRQHIGGLTISGLGATDTGNKAVIGGLAREFYREMKAHYAEDAAWRQETRENFKGYRPQDDALWFFEPHVAEATFRKWLERAGVELILGDSLDRQAGAEKWQQRIALIPLKSGRKIRGKMFIDATYEGDLLAAAGVSYTVGRESNATYGETLNGIQVAHSVHHQFIRPVDGYRKPGDPASGVLPGINEGPGIDGEADHRVQAYNFRICMTDSRENQVPFAKPASYDELQYELLFRNFEAGDPRVPLSIIMMPNRKTDVNNNFAVSTDYIGMNYDYPEASDEVREQMTRDHAEYTRGLFWALANHPRVPQQIRQEVSRWGWAKDEFVDNGHLPYWMYIREARRMISDYVNTELDCRRERICADSVGLGSYNMDSHNCQRYIDSTGHVRNEGDVQVSPGGPYLISYRAIVPRKAECENLFVPVCLSASHIAYGSIRMEPVFMILGQSAATAAVLAIDGNLAVQDVPYAELRKRLLEDKQVLDLPAGTAVSRRIQASQLPGIVLDTPQARLIGAWTASTSVSPFVGQDYLHDGHELPGEKQVLYPLGQIPPGVYEVRVSYAPQGNRATNTLVLIRCAAGEVKQRINQRQKPAIDELFISLGKYEFSGKATDAVLISNVEADGYVIADAVQLLPVDR